MTYVPENLTDTPTQVLKALLALRGDAARNMSVELQAVMNEIAAIAEELEKRNADIH